MRSNALRILCTASPMQALLSILQSTPHMKSRPARRRTKVDMLSSHRVGSVLHHERLGAETDDVVTYYLLDGEIGRGVSYHHRPTLLPLHDLADSDERVLQPRVLQMQGKAERQKQGYNPRPRFKNKLPGRQTVNINQGGG